MDGVGVRLTTFMTTILGMLRVKNEARWIERVLQAMLPVCDSIHLFDDHSTDETPEIAERLGVHVYRSQFEGLDEQRDKQFLMGKLYDSIPGGKVLIEPGNPHSPYWALCLDGDEELIGNAGKLLHKAAASEAADAYSIRILYAWDSPDQVRVDRVYQNFRRPSLFRLMNRAFSFQTTPWGGNLHCSSIPQEMIAGFKPCDAQLLHYGYLDAELRKRKHDWYNQVDPNNAAEDFYRHITQGDPGGLPAHQRLLHAGPLRLLPLADLAPMQTVTFARRPAVLMPIPEP
jgi:glycosyltransferase involved in cell wall biosynthesis